MTREEAIEILSLARFTGSSASELDAISEALDVAIEALKEERPHGEWEVYSHCSDGFSYKCSLCGRVVNNGHWFEQKEILSVYPYCHCGAKMIAVADPIEWYSSLGIKNTALDNYITERGLRAEMGFVDDAADIEPDLKYIKVGDTIYTQDDDKQGWTGKEENK